MFGYLSRAFSQASPLRRQPQISKLHLKMNFCYLHKAYPNQRSPSRSMDALWITWNLELWSKTSELGV